MLHCPVTQKFQKTKELVEISAMNAHASAGGCHPPTPPAPPGSGVRNEGGRLRRDIAELVSLHSMFLTSFQVKHK